MDRHLAAHPAPRLIALATLALLVACGATMPTGGPSEPLPSASPTAAAPDWRAVPEEPYPFVTPVPALAPTAIDGEWDREPTDPSTGSIVACVRCAPYPKDRSRSLLRLELGRWEVIHGEPGYRGYGHYVVEGDRITLFNDPECGTESGSYRWKIDDDRLTLTEIDDPCAFGQRARDLTDRAWVIAAADRCRPPDEEAAVTDHWPAPPGC
ncbi:MAG TPA: hypothetical protein VHR55_07860 [Candidatus Limnocylindria bacterium]|nr:hypothetical protein [Candidatus Limnocylindria bacterium]